MKVMKLKRQIPLSEKPLFSVSDICLTWESGTRNGDSDPTHPTRNDVYGTAFKDRGH